MSDLSTLVQIICIALTTIATIVLAVLTGKYVRLTHSMLEETKSQKEPNVWVDLELSEYSVKFIIGNSGASPAKKIKFEVKDNVPWLEIENNSKTLEKIHPVKNGISYLAPARILKYTAGYIDKKRTFSELDSIIEVKITYETETGKTTHREFVIDIDQYHGVLFESFKDSPSGIAIAIKEVERVLQSIRTKL